MGVTNFKILSLKLPWNSGATPCVLQTDVLGLRGIPCPDGLLYPNFTKHFCFVVW